MTSSHFEQIFRDYALSINNDGGKLRKQGNHLSCGSLSMNLNSGSWNRFSTGDKGDIYGFVEQARGINKKEALEFVAIVAGVEGYKDRGYQQVNAGNLNQQRKEDIAADKPANEWLAVNKVPESAPQFTVSKHLRHMLQEHQCQGTYEYRNVKGELLGYSVRLTETATGDKQVLPVAWCHNAALNKEGWRLKGFSDQGCKPVYGAEKLISTNKPVLIVEGEKTANKAQELLPEYTVLSWLGGSGSADKANWSLCAGKEVVIWPDNDAAGVKAAELIAGKINNLNAYIGMVSVVSPETLKDKAKIQSLEEGWDLGDKLPAGIEIRDVREVITNTRTTARSIVELEKNLKALEDETKFDSTVSDIASRAYLQKVSQGLPAELSVIVAEAKLEASWQEVLSGAESKEYQLYAEARGIKDNPHEFLNINNSKLYRATLGAIAVNKGIEPSNIRENTSGLEQEYDRSKQALYFNPSLQKQHLQQLQSGSVGLYRTLVKDGILLHQIQLDKSLPAAEEQRIVEEVYKIVKPLDNDKELTAAEKVAASDKFFSVINNKEWWKESVEQQVRVAEKAMDIIRDKAEKNGERVEELYRPLQPDKQILTQFSNKRTTNLIPEGHKDTQPEVVRDFKESIQLLSRISPIDAEIALNEYKNKGITGIVDYALFKNIKFIIDSLENNKHILDPSKNIDPQDKDYLNIIGNDRQVMSYVDHILNKEQDIKEVSFKIKERLTAFANERDKEVLKEIVDPCSLAKLTDSIDMLERCGNSFGIRFALDAYNKGGMEEFCTTADKLCSELIDKKIITDLRIMQDKWDKCWDTPKEKMQQIVVKDFIGAYHETKESYLGAIGRDKEIMRYIDPASSIAKQIQGQLDRETNLQRSRGFERE